MLYISIKERANRLFKENERLKAENEKRIADIDYIAMMCDVELESEGEDDVQSEI